MQNSKEISICKRKALVKQRPIRQTVKPDNMSIFIPTGTLECDMAALYYALHKYRDITAKATRNKAASILRAETLPSLEELGIIQLEEGNQVREEPQQEQQNEAVTRWFIHEAHDRLYGDTNPEDAIAVVKIHSEGPVIVCCKPQDLKRAKDFVACCIDLETERKTVKPKILKEEDFA